MQRKNRKKKIALILPTKPRDGGQHQYALVVVQCLIEKVGPEYEIVALSGNSFWRKWCREKGIPYLGVTMPKYSLKEQKFNYRFPFLAKMYYTYITPIGRILRKHKIDIIFSTHQGIFLPNYKVKIIAPVHDLMHRYEPSFPEVRKDFDYREICFKSIARYAKCILVDSKLGKRQFEESYITKRIGRPLVVSLPFVVPEHVRNTQEEYIDVPSKFVFYPAQFWKHKNHINLVKAIQILQKSIKDIHLVLVGSEKNYEKVIREYIVQNHLENNITILGFVTNENVTYLYRHAIGMIMPSYFGPTNIPPLEAMALGCPVAVSNKYAMPEQVGKAGLLFNPDSPDEIANCIERLWIDKELRKNMIQQGYDKIQSWTKNDFGNKLCRVIKKL